MHHLQFYMVHLLAGVYFLCSVVIHVKSVASGNFTINFPNLAAPCRMCKCCTRSPCGKSKINLLLPRTCHTCLNCSRCSRQSRRSRWQRCQASQDTQPGQGTQAGQDTQSTQDPHSSQLKYGILDLYLGKDRPEPVYPNATRYEKS